MSDIFNMIQEILAKPWIRTLIWFVILVLATKILANLVAKLLRHMLRSEENPLPSSSIIVNIARGTVWALGASVILDTCFNVNVSAFIAALGVGGIALSLGFQDTLSNLIGGLQLTFMRVVVPGDLIEVGNAKGRVHDVGWRHTTIDTATDGTVIIPNSVLSKTSFSKLSDDAAVSVPIAGTFADETLDTYAKSIEGSAQKAAESICAITSNPKVQVRFTEITESGFKGQIDLRVADPQAVSAVTDSIVRAVAPFTRA